MLEFAFGDDLPVDNGNADLPLESLDHTVAEDDQAGGDEHKGDE